jgi:hypothetical protein
MIEVKKVLRYLFFLPAELLDECRDNARRLLRVWGIILEVRKRNANPIV